MCVPLPSWGETLLTPTSRWHHSRVLENPSGRQGDQSAGNKARVASECWSLPLLPQAARKAQWAGWAWGCPQQLQLHGKGNGRLRPYCAVPAGGLALLSTFPAKSDPAVAQESDTDQHSPGAAGHSYCGDPSPEAAAQGGFGGAVGQCDPSGHCGASWGTVGRTLLVSEVGDAGQ